MNTFNEAKERAEQDGTEYRYGAVTTDLALVPIEARLPNSPKPVNQFNNEMDTNGCASRAPLNLLEMKLDYFYDHGMHPTLKQWCDDNGYRVDGKFALCDAFIEILSGTTKDGNSLKAPVDCIYRYGVIPARFAPLEDNMTWDEYMNPARITQEMKNLGQQFLLRFGVNYEKVPLSQILSALEEDGLDVALHGWPVPVNGVYPHTDERFNHAVAILDPSIFALDGYEPYTKILARNYKFFDWAFSLSITRQTPDPVEELNKLQQLLQQALKILRGLMGYN